MRNTTMTIVAGALALAITPTVAAAQNGSSTTTASDSTYAAPATNDDGDEFPWGLLGLLGLAGLLGRKKHDTVHVDHNRPRV